MFCEYSRHVRDEMERLRNRMERVGIKTHASAAFLVALFLACAGSAYCQEKIRVASYNIQRFEGGQTTRTERLKKVLEEVNADIWGLQEIDNRASMEAFFPGDRWQFVIDDKSDDTQDVAIAVRRPLKLLNVGPEMSATDRNFLVPDRAQNEFFPKRRDGLVVEVEMPGGRTALSVIVIHAKSRVGGRANNDSRRTGASAILVDILKKDFEKKNYILLGDFNDSPDDASLNILETGDPNSTFSMEENDGPLLVNLMESLALKGEVTEGVGELRIDPATGKLNNVYSESRKRNARYVGTNINTGPLLIDQILFPVGMKAAYVPGSVTIFKNPVALQGPQPSRASDHLPVYADFEISKMEGIAR